MIQPACTVGTILRNAAAESYVRTSIPADPNWKASTSRTASSSSITWTIGFSDDMVRGLLRGRAQRKVKDRSAGRIGLRRDPSTMRLDNCAADRQAYTHAARFACDKRLEQL